MNKQLVSLMFSILCFPSGPVQPNFIIIIALAFHVLCYVNSLSISFSVNCASLASSLPPLSLPLSPIPLSFEWELAGNPAPSYAYFHMNCRYIVQFIPHNNGYDKLIIFRLVAQKRAESASIMNTAGLGCG